MGPLRCPKYTNVKTRHAGRKVAKMLAFVGVNIVCRYTSLYTNTILPIERKIVSDVKLKDWQEKRRYKFMIDRWRFSFIRNDICFLQNRQFSKFVVIFRL